MRQLIAVLVALVLSACSYDPYHYYYSCTDLSGKKVPTIYVHNDVLTNYAGMRWKLKWENDQAWGYDDYIIIEKGTHNIRGYSCTVEKTLFKK